MNGIFFKDGEPCPCCGRPLDLKQSETAHAVCRLGSVIAAANRENRLDLIMLAIDSLFIAADAAGHPGKAYVTAFVNAYCDLAGALDKTGSHEVVGMMVDDMLRRSGQHLPPYEKRRAELAEILHS